MKPGESNVYSESRYSQVSGKLARGWESGGVVVESCRNQLIANLAVKLFMKRLICSAVEPNHFKGHNRMATTLLFACVFICNSFHDPDCPLSQVSVTASLLRSGMAISLQVDG